MENQVELHYVEKLIEHVNSILHKQFNTEDLMLDWTKTGYKNPSLNATTIIYELLKSLTTQIEEQDKLSVSTAKMLIPLTKHCNACRVFMSNNNQNIPQTNETQISKLKIKQLESEILDNKKLINTLKQYKNMYLASKSELKKLNLKEYTMKEIHPNEADSHSTQTLEKLVVIGEAELTDCITQVYQNINDLLVSLQQNASLSVDEVNRVRMLFKTLYGEIEHFKYVFKQQIPLLKDFLEKTTDFPANELLNKLSQLEMNTSQIQSALTKSSSAFNQPTNEVETINKSPVLHANEQVPTERFIEFLKKQVEEYKNCVETVESEAAELYSKNCALKKRLKQQIKSSPSDPSKYIAEIEQRDKMIKTLRVENQALEEQLIDALK